MNSDDIARFAWSLRAMDVEEVVLMAGEGAYDNLARGFHGRAFTAWADLRPVAAFGVTDGGSGTGRPWLLGTYEINRVPIAFARASRRFLPSLGDGFARLESWVWAEYGAAIRWLRWLGFVIEDPAPAGVVGASFRRFWMEV